MAISVFSTPTPRTFSTEPFTRDVLYVEYNVEILLRGIANKYYRRNSSPRIFSVKFSKVSLSAYFRVVELVTISPIHFEFVDSTLYFWNMIKKIDRGPLHGPKLHLLYYFLLGSRGVTFVTTPTATVIPISRTAKRPSCGSSLYGSITIGLRGTSFAIMLSPRFTKSGFSCVT